MDTASMSLFFAVLTLACWAGLVAGAVVWLTSSRSTRARGWSTDLSHAALPMAWVVAAIATLGSLSFSEIAGFVPCPLCWYQRIAMYPLAVILGIATVRRDPDVRWYALPLAGIGAVIGAYHSWLQAYPPAGGSSFCTLDASCTVRHVWELGFVSLPLMATTGFVSIAALLVVARRPVPERTPS